MSKKHKKVPTNLKYIEHILNYIVNLLIYYWMCFNLCFGLLTWY